jgi:Skp family chaperone for outer membrane proteins
MDCGLILVLHTNHGSKGVLKVNFNQWIASSITCSLFLVSTWSSIAHAQTKVALVDMGRVFKNHPEFTAKLEQLRNQATQFRTQSEQEQQQFLKKTEILDQFVRDSDEYRDTEAKLAKESASLEVEQRASMRELLKQEASLHADIYSEVNEFIAQYCSEHSIQLILRFNSDPVDAANPQSIMQRVNSNVVYYAPDKDVTNVIIQRISQVKGSAAPNNDK